MVDQTQQQKIYGNPDSPKLLEGTVIDSFPVPMSQRLTAHIPGTIYTIHTGGEIVGLFYRNRLIPEDGAMWDKVQSARPDEDPQLGEYAQFGITKTKLSWMLSANASEVTGGKMTQVPSEWYEVDTWHKVSEQSNEQPNKGLFAKIFRR